MAESGTGVFISQEYSAVVFNVHFPENNEKGA